MNFALNDLPDDNFVVSEPCDPDKSLLENKSPRPDPIPYDLMVSLDPSIQYQTDYEPAPPLSPEVEALILRTDIDAMTGEEILTKGSYSKKLDEAISILEFGINKFGSSDVSGKARTVDPSL